MDERRLPPPAGAARRPAGRHDVRARHAAPHHPVLQGPLRRFDDPRDAGTPPRRGLLVRVPAGPFLMGLPDDDLLAEDHEKPRRAVELPAFWVDVYPVTNARFARFVAAGGYDDAGWWSAEGWAWREASGVRRPACWGRPGWDGREQPAAGVSWYEADAYARWAGRRLPTDAEWEKAARGADGRRYPWGDDWPSAAVANFDMSGRPHVAGRPVPRRRQPLRLSRHGRQRQQLGQRLVLAAVRPLVRRARRVCVAAPGRRPARPAGRRGSSRTRWIAAAGSRRRGCTTKCWGVRARYTARRRRASRGTGSGRRRTIHRRSHWCLALTAGTTVV